MGAVAVLFLLFDGVTHVMSVAPVVEAFARLGYPAGLATGIGVLELLCLAVYIVPRASVLGAVLLTGYLGGAVAAQVRIGEGLFPTLFPIFIAALVWGALFIVDERLVPLLAQRSR